MEAKFLNMSGDFRMGYRQGFRATWSEQLACFLGDCKLPQQERDYGATQVSLPTTYSLSDNKVTTERTAKTHIQEEQDIYR